MKLDPEALVKAHEKLNVMCHPELGATYDLRAAITAYLASLPQSQDIRALVERLRKKRMRVHDLSGVGYEADEDCIAAADALSCLAGEGWRRVPVEPTEAMLSNLPKDIYVIEAFSHGDIAFDVKCCSVPMMTVPEVRYTRADLVAQWHPGVMRALSEKPIQTSDTKGLSAVLREWAGNYEEGSFDTEAGLMIEAADRIETAEALVRSASEVLNRLTAYAPDVGVDEFLDALNDARSLIARIDGAE